MNFFDVYNNLIRGGGIENNPSNASAFDGASNILTGNLDYNRNVALMNAEQKFNSEEAEKARLFNSAEAQKQRDWQEMMARQQYQMSVEDMKRAGINPYAQLGHGATFGSGASASASATHSAGHSAMTAGQGLVGIIGSALNAYNASQQRELGLLKLEQTKIDNELLRQIRKHKYRTEYDGKGNLIKEIFEDDG